MQSILIVGLGSIGRRHARVFRAAGLTDISGVDLRQDRLDQARQELGLESLGTSYQDMLASRHFDAVLITTPTAFHTPIALAAAQAGCHLFIEKPVADVDDGLEEVAAVVREKGLIAYTAYCYRFAPSAERVKAIVESGQLGRIHSARLEISSYLPDWHPWEDYRSFYMAKMDQGGGARLDESHGIDLLRWLFGDVARVSAFVDKVSDLEITSDDLTVMLLRFQSGLVAEAHFDLLGRSPRIGLELIGADGTLLWDRVAGRIDLYNPADKAWATEDFGKDDFVKSYDRQAAHFIDCVRSGTPPRTDLESGRRTLRVLEAALASSDKGQAVAL